MVGPEDGALEIDAQAVRGQQPVDRRHGRALLRSGPGLALALEKIAERFGVRTLMLEGGGRINGSMLREGLVDFVSLLVAPVVDGRIGMPAVFDVDGEDIAPFRLALESVERRADDVLWLRYRVAR